MLKDDTRIQLDLYDNLKIDKILFQVLRSEVSNGRSKCAVYDDSNTNSSTNATRARSS